MGAPQEPGSPLLAPEFVLPLLAVFGTGVQARLQLRYLRGVVKFDHAVAWGRDAVKLERYRADMAAEGFRVEAASSAADLAAVRAEIGGDLRRLQRCRHA